MDDHSDRVIQLFAGVLAQAGRQAQTSEDAFFTKETTRTTSRKLSFFHICNVWEKLLFHDLYMDVFPEFLRANWSVN